MADSTLVAFCSDNGPEGKARTSSQTRDQRKKSGPGSAGPFRGRKRDLYEGGVRVPAVIEWPERIPKGSVTDFPRRNQRLPTHGS